MTTNQNDDLTGGKKVSDNIRRLLLHKTTCAAEHIRQNVVRTVFEISRC